MTTDVSRLFDELVLDHVEFYVSDLAASTAWLVDGFGLGVYATSDPADTSAEVRSAAIGRNEIRFVLTEPLVGDHPGAAYLERHGDGVADIALRVPDAAAAFDEAVRRGARPVAPPVRHGGVVTATTMGFGDVAHTFVQRTGDVDDRALPGIVPVDGARVTDGSGVGQVDHFAVCVAAGEMDPTVAFYRQVFGFDLIFSERIVVGTQAITTKVVQSRSGSVTFTLIEPDVSMAAGQIDEFIKNHGGPGVQHIAFTAQSIVDEVAKCNANGVEFLSTPATYYAMLMRRLTLSRYSVEQLKSLDVLVDADHDGQLFQIFAKSVHPRGTVFFELIERLGARSFGTGNITALYQAVELQRDSEDG